MSTASTNYEPPAIPAFLTKLRLLVDDEETNDLIYWDPGGSSFHIADGNRLAKEILPLFFKHNNLSSFIRQLNMYGFRKVTRIEPALVGFKSDNEDMEFKHPFFIRHKPHLLSKIHRKPPNSTYSGFLNGRMFNGLGSTTYAQPNPVPESPSIGQRAATVSDFMRLSAVIRTMRITHESMAHQMNLLQSENELLFRELHDLRERHERQSQLIQTLFSFLSVFAKDTRAQGFHFGVKRKALPLALSDGLPSHSGLRLNLPQGYRLDDNSLQQLKLSPATELDDVPYKLARREPESVSAHNQLVALTNPNSPGHLFPDQPYTSSARPWDEALDATLNFPNLSTVAFKSKSGKHSTLSKLASRNPVQLVTSGAPKAFDADHILQSSTVDELDIKPFINESDLTLASLTTRQQPTKPMDFLDSTTSEDLGNSSLIDSDGQQQLVDLNLSRSTTPASLIQPDSVDICELLATNRNDNESEISIDDLFLASGALDDFKNSQDPLDRFGKSSSLTTPRGGRDSVDSVLLNAFRNEQENVVLSTTEPATSMFTTTTTATMTDSLNGSPVQSVVGSRRSSLVRCSIQPSQNLEDLGREDLFGLPWDGQHDDEVLHLQKLDNRDEPKEVDGTVDSTNQLSGGLLPVPDTRQKPGPILPRPTKATNRRASSSGRTFIIGNELTPTDAVTSYAPSTLVHVIEPTTIVPVASCIANPTTMSPQRSSPPVLISRCQPKLFLPAISVGVGSPIHSTACLVSTTPVTTLSLTQTPVQLTTPFVQLHPTQIIRPAVSVRSNPNSRLGATSRRKERPTFRPIAPAPYSIVPRAPTSGSLSKKS